MVTSSCITKVPRAIKLAPDGSLAERGYCSCTNKMASAQSTEAITLLTEFRSWQIVSERGFDDVLVAMGCGELGVHTRTDKRRSTAGLPRVTHEVGVLRTYLNGPFGAFIKAVPEACRSLDHVACVCGAIRRIAGEKPVRLHRHCSAGKCGSWRHFGVATEIIGRRRTISNGLAGGVELIVPADELGACVEVNIKFSGVNFERSQTLSTLKQGDRSIGINRH